MDCDAVNAYALTRVVGAEKVLKIAPDGTILWEVPNTASDGIARSDDSIAVNSATNTVFVTDENTLLLLDTATGSEK